MNTSLPKIRKNIFLIYGYLVFTLLCVQSVLGQQVSKLIAADAELTKVASDYSFTEGPASDRAGNVYFTDQPNDRIIKWSVRDGSVSVYMVKTSRSNGLYIDDAGHIIACADQNNELMRIDQNKVQTVLINNYEGKKLNGPNDLWIDSKGGIYFTDPFYKRPYWTRTEKEIQQENVYYLNPDGKTLSMVASEFVRPNGIVGTKNGKKLYVADIGDKKTYVFKIMKDGTLKNRKLFTEMGSDGMTLDHKGNLYVTGTEGVTVFNKRGKQIEQIEVPERWTANVCFGGADQNKLFITASGSVYTLDMKVSGIRW